MRLIISENQFKLLDEARREGDDKNKKVMSLNKIESTLQSFGDASKIFLSFRDVISTTLINYLTVYNTPVGFYTYPYLSFKDRILGRIEDSRGRYYMKTIKVDIKYEIILFNIMMFMNEEFINDEISERFPYFDYELFKKGLHKNIKDKILVNKFKENIEKYKKDMISAGSILNYSYLITLFLMNFLDDFVPEKIDEEIRLFFFKSLREVVQDEIKEEKVKVTENNNIDFRLIFPFASNRRYLYILKVKDDANIIDYTFDERKPYYMFLIKILKEEMRKEENLEFEFDDETDEYEEGYDDSLIKQSIIGDAIRAIESEDIEVFSSIFKRTVESENIDYTPLTITPCIRLYRSIMLTALACRPQSHQIFFNSLCRKMKIDGFSDLKGEEYIHSNEPIQTLFFNTNVFEKYEIINMRSSN